VRVGRIAAAAALAFLAGSAPSKAAPAAVPPAAKVDAADLLPRAYAVRYKSLADAAEVVSTVLSPQGSVTLQPRLKTLVVQDHPVVLDRVGALLASFDLPPRNVEVTLSLFLGTDRREQEAGRSVPPDVPSRDVRGIAETLADFTKWNAYAPLGKGFVTGAEGERVTVNLSDEYRVSYEIETVQDANVKLRGFALYRVSRGTDGKESLQTVYTASVVLPVGRSLMLGAAQNPESKRALFLALSARPR